MAYPKVVIASDGQHTGVLLDGVFIGQGISRLDFSTHNKDGERKSSIRFMDIDVKNASLQTDERKFLEFCEGIAEKE